MGRKAQAAQIIHRLEEKKSIDKSTDRAGGSQRCFKKGNGEEES